MEPAQHTAFNYFFTVEARGFLAGQSAGQVGVDDLERASDFAVRMIGHAKNRERFSPWFANDGAELRCIALCRMLFAAAHNHYAAGLFGEGMSKLCVARLSLENERDRMLIASQLYPSLGKNEGGGYGMSMADYLSGQNELAYAPLEDGKIEVSAETVLEMVGRNVAGRASEFGKIDAKSLPPLVREFAADFSASLPQSPSLAPSQFSGKYLSKPCFQKVLGGVGEGKRYYGSMALAIACLRDGLSKAEAAALMKQYVASCTRTSHEFRESEALSTLDWVYRHPAINLSCKMMIQQGLIGRYCDDCPAVRRKRQDSAIKENAAQ